jgi:tripartite ATP-independent transporter DctM subunit
MVLLFVVFFVTLLIGVPIFIALAGSSLVYTHLIAGIPDFVILHRMAGGVDSFPLLAVPFFILAGNLMNSAGITNRIYDFAVALVGWLRGGLGHVNVVGSVIFSGMSGTAVADAGGLGTIEIKAMRDHGYNTEFAVGVTAASATIGPIIPPSLPMVIFGVMANVSIGQLFAAGFIPGLLMAAFLMIYVTWYAHRHNIGRDQAFRLSILGSTFVQALPALMTPAIIIGGMSFGIFTPTEAAVCAVAYSFLVGMFIYRELKLSMLYGLMLQAAKTTAVVMFLVAAALVSAWLMTSANIPGETAKLLAPFMGDKMLLMAAMMMLVLVVGTALDFAPTVLILTPVLMPIVKEAGIDPVYFGVLFIMNTAIGLITPPVGIVLNVVCGVAKVPMGDVMRGVWPFLVAEISVLVLLILFPDLVMVPLKWLTQ